ncbi:hypothetical protein HC662_08010 [Bacillus subtilis]|nr:hypothetical protein HC662_08010 [Bacillus subtilis]
MIKLDDKNEKRFRNINAKKRIMFNRDEDYYFITYNILIILYKFDCKDAKTKWIDYNKLSYLFPLVADKTFLDLYIRYIESGRRPTKAQHELLRATYIKSRLRLKLITSILFTLESNNLVCLMKNEKRHTIDIWINQDNISKAFLTSTLFDIEVDNISKLKKVIPRLKTLSTKTLLERLYTNNGVSVWEV